MESLVTRRQRPPARAEESEASPAWHALRVKAVLRKLGSSPQGLDPEEAQRRIARDGPNRVAPPPARGALSKLAAQFANLPTALLLGSSGFSAVLGERPESAAILSVLGLNGAIGYRIERQNEKVLEAWRRGDAGRARVLRGGALVEIPESELVRGDVLLCEAGQVVPADARVLVSDRLACDESTLTGESEPREKDEAPVRRDALPGDRCSMLLAGSTIVAGRGRAVVTATGAASTRGTLQRSLESVASGPTPIERRFAELGDRVAWGGLVAGAAGAAAGMLRGNTPGRVVRTAVALGIAAIPEGLPVVATAALVRAMQRLRRHGIVVRRLASAETLGAVDVVCTDKTGTLTENDMRLATLHVGDRSYAAAELHADARDPLGDAVTLALVAGVLNSDVDLVANGRGLEVAGSATERALVRAAVAAGLDPLVLGSTYPRRQLVPRLPGRDYVVTVHDAPSGAVAFAKGSPEQVLALCAREGGRRLDAARRARLAERASALAADGCRVLALAWRPLSAGTAVPRAGFELLGLAGLSDPLRPNAAAAVRTAADAGIRTVLLTGDHRRTAESVARAAGLAGDVVEGSEELRLLLRAPRSRFERVSVFARVTPEDKLAVVRRLQELGHVVAMAGDGINDAPALKAADVGIAVGGGASDLARRAADLVLASGDLQAVLSAIDHGRVVQDNLRRAVQFLLATNLSEILLVLGATLAGAGQGLSPMQLLWINLVSDTLPALALALQPGPGMLQKPPTAPGTPLVSGSTARRVAVDGVLMAALGAAGLAIGGPPLAFSALSAAQLGYVLACRTPEAPLGRDFKALWVASFAIQLLALGFPPLRRLLALPPALSPLEVTGFGAALLLPLLRSGADRVIVRHGPAWGHGPSTTRPTPSRRARPREGRNGVDGHAIRPGVVPDGLGRRRRERPRDAANAAALRRAGRGDGAARRERDRERRAAG